jgi:hypothetical protein
MNERYIKWWTPHLSRDFEMLAFGNGGGVPLILFPTSFGRYSQNKDFWPYRLDCRVRRQRQDHDLLPGLRRS